MTDKEKIIEQINRIEQYARRPDNKWLLDELCNRFGRGGDLYLIKKIEHYLGLDYKLDSADSILDYSFIEDESIRDQLISDNREMMRYRYGVRSHKIDFDEFCRYAHLQAEMLVNVYLNIIYKDYYTIKHRIIQSTPNAKISDDYPHVEGIAYSYKIKTIVSDFFPPEEKSKAWFSSRGQGLYDTLINIKEVRNTQSHRSEHTTPELFMKNYEEKVIALGIPWDSNKKDFLWQKINVNDRYKSDYENQLKADRTKYLFYKWYVSEPYNEVIGAISSLIHNVRRSIG